MAKASKKISITAGEPPKEYDVIVELSPRRRKTVSGMLTGSTVHAKAPMRMSERRLRKTLTDLVEFLLRKQRHKIGNGDGALLERAKTLCERFLPDAKILPQSVVISPRLTSSWGLCDITEKQIRLNKQIEHLPAWVVDYLLLHEAAHLIFPNHGNGFKALVGRYSRTKEARAFLEGYSLAQELTKGNDLC